jgi:DNA-binding transcriptional ArsR family regulator
VRVLRIHFTGDDLAKVRVATEPDPLWESVVSLFRFRYTDAPLVFGPWRRAALRRSQRSTFDTLLPFTPDGYFPDFLNPAAAALGIDAGIEAILSTPRARLASDMELLATTTRTVLPPWARDIGSPNTGALKRLAAGLRAHHDAAIAPSWGQAKAHVDADRAKRAKAFLDGGCEGLLNSFRPTMRWQSPVLEVDFATDYDMHLDGRGLLLVPSYFCWNTPDSLRDPTLPPVLVYPVEHDIAIEARAVTDAGDASLAALMGATRAAILASIDSGRTTGELARKVGVTAGAISQHTAVLRGSRLIRTSRVGKAVVHSLTPLGAAILDNLTY